MKNKKLFFIYLLIIFLSSGCLNFRNINSSSINSQREEKDAKSTWFNRSPDNDSSNESSSSSQNDLENNSEPIIDSENDIIVNGVYQPKPTEELRKLEIKEQEETDKVADISLKYISSSKEYLSLSRSLPQVTSIQAKDCSGCFIVSIEYNILDPQTPGNLIIKYVELEITDWKIIETP